MPHIKYNGKYLYDSGSQSVLLQEHKGPTKVFKIICRYLL